MATVAQAAQLSCSPGTAQGWAPPTVAPGSGLGSSHSSPHEGCHTWTCGTRWPGCSYNPSWCPLLLIALQTFICGLNWGSRPATPSELLELPQLQMGKLRLEDQVEAATGCAQGYPPALGHTHVHSHRLCMGAPPSPGHTHVHSHRPLGVPRARRDCPGHGPGLQPCSGTGCLMHFWGSEV